MKLKKIRGERGNKIKQRTGDRTETRRHIKDSGTDRRQKAPDRQTPGKRRTLTVAAPTPLKVTRGQVSRRADNITCCCPPPSARPSLCLLPASCYGN